MRRNTARTFASSLKSPLNIILEVCQFTAGHPTFFVVSSWEPLPLSSWFVSLVPFLSSASHLFSLAPQTMISMTSVVSSANVLAAALPSPSSFSQCLDNTQKGLGPFGKLFQWLTLDCVSAVVAADWLNVFVSSVPGFSLGFFEKQKRHLFLREPPLMSEDPGNLPTSSVANRQ